MIPEEILARLEAVGTAQNRKIYARHGVKEPFYGVSFANLDKIAKEIRKDKTIDRNALAQELWASGVHDARLLATKIAEPRTMEPSIYDAWVQNLDNYVITDGFSNLVGSSPYALEKMQAWIQDPGEWISTAGWNLLGQLAMNDPALSEEFFTGYLPVIERSIHGCPNRTRYAMNNALIAIGIRNRSLEAGALSTAEAVGEVVVDHGETGCVTPFAPDYIRKTWLYREQKSGKNTP